MPKALTMFVYDPSLYVKNVVTWPGNKYFRIFYPSYADVTITKEEKTSVKARWRPADLSPDPPPLLFCFLFLSRAR